MKRPISLALVFLLCTSAIAQDTSLQDKALAAGYKAMFTCSAVFNGGKTIDQISTDELDHIYPDFGPGMQAVGDAEVDATTKIVSVKYADDLPPRLSAWREHLGCTALPQGASKSAVKHLPRVKLKLEQRDMSTIPWPMGDLQPNRPPPKTIDGPALAASVKKAFDGEFGGATTSVLVMQNGRILNERYREGWDEHSSQRTWSVPSRQAVIVRRGYDWRGNYFDGPEFAAEVLASLE